MNRRAVTTFVGSPLEIRERILVLREELSLARRLLALSIRINVSAARHDEATTPPSNKQGVVVNA
jgi:hypothetical protein